MNYANIFAKMFPERKFEYRMRGTNGNNESAFRGFRGFRTRNKSTELIQPFCG